MNEDHLEVDVIVVGAGFGGLYALQKLRSLGKRVLLLEAGTGVGGTWYWNRYPGARVDLESVEYSYSFSPEIQEEWSWAERYAGQEEVERYLNFVADRLDLRRDTRLGYRVTSARLDEDSGTWMVRATAERGSELFVSATHCILAVGFLSAPMLPDIPGVADFGGEIYHTADWPKEEPTFEGRRVGVLGTGASGVQVIQTIAPKVGHLTVFQRTANWCLPLRNAPVAKSYEQYVKTNYPEIRGLERTERGGGAVLMGERIAPSERRTTGEVDVETVIADFEQRWKLGGLHMGRSFVGLTTDKAANDLLRDFLTKKIRAQIDDPALADLLVPTIPPLSRRTPGENNYYSVYNRSNVRLVDVRDNPIVSVEGNDVVLTLGQRIELDVLICATGFDAGTGSVLGIDIVGRNGVRLAEAWSDGAKTSLGFAVHGFPNLFLINSVQSPSAFFSPPLVAEHQVDLAARLIAVVEERGWRGIDATAKAQSDWVERVEAVVEGSLVSGTKSWWIGTNVAGKPQQVVAFYGGFPAYVKASEEYLSEIHAADRGGYGSWGPAA